VKPLIKSPPKFEHFMKVQNRCQKIDTLDAMRKELEPKKAQAGIGIRLNNKRGGGRPEPNTSRPLTAD